MTTQALATPATAQPDSLSESQSLGIVRIFLNAALACIAHTRELVPWVSESFQTRYIHKLNVGSADGADLYAKFCDRSSPSANRPDSQETRVLLYGGDKRADSILNIIDGGVADALQQNCLDALQVFITADPKDPAAVLESYTFHFTYAGGAVRQVTISSQIASFLSIKEVHHSFNVSIRALLRSMKGLPRLPKHRTLGMSLLFNDDCTQSYQPEGFIDVNEVRYTPVRGDWSDLWCTPTESVAKFEVGSRLVTVATRALRFQYGTTCSQLADVGLSNQIRKMQNTSSRDANLVMTAQTARTPEVFSGQSESHLDTRRTGSSHLDIVSNDPAHPALPTKRSDFSTDQSPRRAPATLNKSKGSVNCLSSLSVASKNRRRRNVVPGKLAELILQARAMENCDPRPTNIFDHGQLQCGRITRIDREGVVNCECGSQHEDLDTLLCELCGTRQHKICYGYESLRPGCLPEEHFCYSCLLLPREDTVSHDMPGKVHMRLALRFLASQPEGEVLIGQEFQRAVYLDRRESGTKFLALINRLNDEGFLTQPSDGTSQILNNGNLTEAQSIYLDPLAGIVHHYQIVRDGDTYEKRNQEILHALKLYIGNRQLSLDDVSNSLYDQVHVRDNYDKEVVRWGFYTGWKRKRIDAAESPTRRRKISVTNKFVNVNRSSSSDTVSMGKALQEVASEAVWDLRTEARFSSKSPDFR